MVRARLGDGVVVAGRSAGAAAGVARGRSVGEGCVTGVAGGGSGLEQAWSRLGGGRGRGRRWRAVGGMVEADGCQAGTTAACGARVRRGFGRGGTDGDITDTAPGTAVSGVMSPSGPARSGGIGDRRRRYRRGGGRRGRRVVLVEGCHQLCR